MFEGLLIQRNVIVEYDHRTTFSIHNLHEKSFLINLLIKESHKVLNLVVLVSSGMRFAILGILNSCSFYRFYHTIEDKYRLHKPVF